MPIAIPQLQLPTTIQNLQYTQIDTYHGKISSQARLRSFTILIRRPRKLARKRERERESVHTFSTLAVLLSCSCRFQIFLLAHSKRSRVYRKRVVRVQGTRGSSMDDDDDDDVAGGARKVPEGTGARERFSFLLFLRF